MLLFLSKYWPWILGTALGLVVFFTVLHWKNEAAKVPSLQDEIRVLNITLATERKRTEDNKFITERESQAYEDIITKRDADLRKLRNRPATCIPVQLTQPTNSGNATNKPDKQNIATGIYSSTLYDFAGEAETDRAKVVTLQKFIRETWKANGQ